MFKPRRIDSSDDWLDADGTKLYTVSASGESVAHAPFLAGLADMKSSISIPWEEIASFAIFHDGITLPYLVLAWWGNENEMFTRVSAREQDQWMEDSSKYSFCLWDLEIMWHERNIFVTTMYSGSPSLEKFRQQRFHQS